MLNLPDLKRIDNNKNLVSAIRVLPVAGIYFWMLLKNDFISDSSQYHPDHYVLWGLVIVSFFLISLFHLFVEGNIRITELDCWLTLYILVAMASDIHFDGIWRNESQGNLLMAWLFYLICRFSLRGSQGMPFMAGMLVLAVGIEFILCFMQFSDSWQFSAEMALSVTGSMGNSGILAGFLAALSPLVFWSAGYSGHRKQLRFAAAVLILLVLFVTRSRAAFVGFFFVTGALAGPVLFRWFKKLKRSVRMIFSVALLTGLSGLLVVPFFFKANSTFGRLFIWKVSASHIAGKPLMGVGFGEFSHRYVFWQEEYFREHPDRRITEGKLADVPSVCFNDPLQIALETGIIGLSIFVLMNIRLLTVSNCGNNKDPVIRSLRLFVPAFLFFSFFSYPLHSIPFLYTYFVVIALVAGSSQRVKTVSFSKPAKVTLAAGLFSMAVFGFTLFWKKDRAVKRWNRAGSLAGVSDEQALYLYREAYPDLRQVALFMHEYGVFLYNRRDYLASVGILEEAKENIEGIHTLLFLGRSYMKLNAFEKAKSVFLQASQILPDNFESNYLLVNAFLACHQEDSAISAARYILQMPVKIPSPAVDQILDEMRQFVRRKEGNE